MTGLEAHRPREVEGRGGPQNEGFTCLSLSPLRRILNGVLDGLQRILRDEGSRFGPSLGEREALFAEEDLHESK